MVGGGKQNSTLPQERGMKMSHEGNDFLREKQWEELDEPVVTHSFEDHDSFTVTGEQVDLMRVADIIIQIKKGGYLSESE